jgi:GntR family transcriptional regulator of arabinose operon
MPPRTSEAPKYQQVHEILVGEIKSGRWKTGDRLPSEAELVRRFGASRITVGRAVRDLQLAGVVERRAGSGTFVKAAASTGGLSFGLLIPDLGETDIFEPICQGMMGSPLARQHALLWGSLPGNPNSNAKGDRAWQLCRQYIERRVAGVFFAPLEHTPDKDHVNAGIAEALDEARIPVVLLDREVLPYPRRGPHDLVGIDNRRAGFLVTEHLLQLGARRIAFVGLPNAAATVAAREAGYREALFVRQATIDPALVRLIDPVDMVAVRDLLANGRPDGIVCANDWTAARLQRSLIELGKSVPREIRLVGIDDVPYAELLPVPLTTLRQPTRELGAAALAAMLDRVSGAELSTRDILLHGTLIVRKSCGAAGT